LYCHNRFYGPLVVAFNEHRPPFSLLDFKLKDLKEIERVN